MKKTCTAKSYLCIVKHLEPQVVTVRISHAKHMYIVEDENVLGYTFDEKTKKRDFVRINVIAVDVLKGGDPILINHTILAINYRAATKEDEERFFIRLGL